MNKTKQYTLEQDESTFVWKLTHYFASILVRYGARHTIKPLYWAESNTATTWNKQNSDHDVLDAF